MKIKVACSQFPVSGEIDTNKKYITDQMQEANAAGCHIIHFPEGSLSGYAGIDFPSFENYDWNMLKESTLEIMQIASELELYVILGSAHPLSGPTKPHNSLYIIDNKGSITDRYDKRFCAGDIDCTMEDLAHFTPGDHFSIFEINGIKCSCLICHEFRYPELYRELKKAGVQIVFHSYHAGNMLGERLGFMESQVGEALFEFNPGRTIPEITMPSTMISYAANNYLWISCSNTSARQSCWASFVVRPDGVIKGKMEKNKAGILITEIDTNISFYDSTKAWRKRAMKGQYNSGELVRDTRSVNRNIL